MVPCHESVFRLCAGIAILALSACATYAPESLATMAEAGLAAPAPRIPATGGRSTIVDLGQSLTPRTLGLVAVIANPDLKAARAQAEVAGAQVFAAGLLPDPTFNFNYDALLSGPDSYSGLGAQVIYDLMTLRDRRVILAGARATRAQVRFDLAWREWQTAGQARLLAARIAGLQTAAPLLERSRRAADDALSRVVAAAAQGDLKADDVESRRLAVADAADRALQGEHDLDAARRDLDTLLGLPPTTRLAIESDPPAPAPPAPEALFARARTARLDLRALEAGYQSQEAAVRKAVWDAFPTLQLTLSRAQDTSGNQTFGPAVNFTLPLWNRDGGGIAIARATREQLRAEYAARVFAIRAEISGLTEELAVDRRRRAEIAAQTTPLERVAARAEAAAAAGDISRAAAEATRQTIIDRQVALAALDQAIAERMVGLELAVGAPLADSVDGRPSR